MAKLDRRLSNPDLDASAIAKGLKRRRDDKVNDRMYMTLVSIIILLLLFFIVGGLYKEGIL